MHYRPSLRPPQRIAAAVVAVVALASLSGCATLRGHVSGAGGATSIPATNPAAEKLLFDSANSLRAAHHVHALALHTNLVQKARFWALWMANGNGGRAPNGTPAICHSSLTGGIKVHWTMLEENVGAASPKTNVAGVANAFKNSPPHLANIVNPKVTYVGIGVAYHGNTVYVVEEFMATS